MGTIDAESSRVSRPAPAYAATAEKILELAKTAHFRYLEQSFERTSWPTRNGAIELHLRSRKSLSHLR